MATDLGAMDAALRLLTAGYGAVIGSRAHHASQVEDRRSPARKVGAAVFRTLARGIVPGVTDTQCGFKFFSGPLARAAALPLRTTGFAFDIELIANCLRLGATLTEIPVRWRDVPGSTFSVRRHSTSAFRDIASIWLRSRMPPSGQLPPGGQLPAGGQLPSGRDLPLNRQELSSADLGRLAAGATTT
jgi:dolichyl-phosphate beta-glucosyltransferase